jgi:hypothetical protein
VQCFSGRSREGLDEIVTEALSAAGVDGRWIDGKGSVGERVGKQKRRGFVDSRARLPIILVQSSRSR